MSDVKVPGLGTQKKTTVYMVGAGVIVVIGVAYYRRKKSASSTSTTGTTDPTAIDPATGFAYGSTEDATALAGQSAYQNPVDYGGGGGPPSSTPPTAAAFTSNPQWEQAAVTFLSDTVGLSSSAVSTALGHYLNGTAVGPSDRALIEQAIAAEGQPPSAGPNGYPPSIRDIAAPPPGVKLATPALRQVAKSHTTATLSWTRVPNASMYHIFRNGHHSEIVSSATVSHAVGYNGAYTVVAMPAATQTHYVQSNGSNTVYVSGLPKG